MSVELKLYIAGKVSKESVFGQHHWRDNFCNQLEAKTGIKIINLDPTKSNGPTVLDENNSRLIVGRECYLIKNADFVVVYLTDDISVGGSQEMLIAKYFKKPLIGLLPVEGKFQKKEKELMGVVYKNWTHAFVKESCDVLVHNIDELATFIKTKLSGLRQTKDLSIFDESIKYYEDYFLDKEQILR